jgi:hypothetical protein
MVLVAVEEALAGLDGHVVVVTVEAGASGEDGGAGGAGKTAGWSSRRPRWPARRGLAGQARGRAGRRVRVSAWHLTGLCTDCWPDKPCWRRHGCHLNGGSMKRPPYLRGDIWQVPLRRGGRRGGDGGPLVGNARGDPNVVGLRA